MLTYDQTSEIRCAFEEAFIEPGRRRAIRFKQRVHVQIYPWSGGRAADPVNVIVEDFSAYGVGILDSNPLELGTHYMLKVPRRDQEDLQVLFTVVRRCQVEPSTYSLGLEATAILKPGSTPPQANVDKYMNSIVGRRVKILFLLFGIIGIAAAVHIGAM